MRKLLGAGIAIAVLFGPEISFADCPSLFRGNADQVASSLLRRSTLVFLGQIKAERFIGKFSRIDDMKSPPQPVAITYRVEALFKGDAGPTITLRTPFVCDDECSNPNKRQEFKALMNATPRHVIVYSISVADIKGQRDRLVSGFCPPSIDARHTCRERYPCSFENCQHKHRQKAETMKALRVILHLSQKGKMPLPVGSNKIIRFVERNRGWLLTITKSGTIN